MTDTDGGVTAYAYDAAGRRISKKLPNGAAFEYAWDAKGQLVERIETGKGGGLANGAKTSYRYKYDADGNRTKEALEEGKGNGRNLETAQSQQTEPAGRIEPEDEFFAYTGYLYDGSTGLYYAKDRYYDAEAGRFIRKDRCENDSSTQDSLNRYVYVGNNPIKYTDPSGKFAIPLYAAVGLVLLVYGTVYIISVNAGYLRTKEGKKLLPYTDEIIYGQSTYSVDDFLSHLSSVGKAAKELYQSAKKEVKKFWKLVKSLGKSKGNAKGKTDSAQGKGKTVKPEAGVTGSKKHGVKWKEGKARAKKEGKPQGQWDQDDLDYATEKANTLKPGESAEFNLPKGSKSKIHMPDGSTKPATKFWIRNNGTGTWHGYPKP